MADETATIPTGTETQAAPAEQSSPAPAITLEQVQSMVDDAARKARDSAFAEARRMFEGKSKAADPQKPQQQSNPTATPPDQNRLRMFDRAVAKYSLSDEQITDLDILFANANPENVTDWVTSKAKAFAGVPSPQTVNPATPTQSKPVPPPTSVAPAPMSVVPSDAPDNILSWSEDQFSDYMSKHAPVPNDPTHPRNAAVRRTLAQKVHAALSNRRLVFEPRRNG